MAEKIKPELLGFLQRSSVPLRILVVESSYYLKELREMFPQSHLFAVVRDKDKMDNCEDTSVAWSVLDYSETPLPYPKEYFDLIVSDLTLETVANPQDIAAGFSTYLKETGVFLTSFRNIRHWSVIKNLMEGHFYGIVTRLYAREEFERLLYASFYKEVRIRSQKREGEGAFIKGLVDAGFENLHDDLNTEFYLVWAARSMPELSLLKSMFTSEVRRKLSRLIHRIEYEVDDNACRDFWMLYDEAGIFADYAAAFIKETVMHHEIFYRCLLASKRKDEAKKILQEALRDAVREKDELNSLWAEVGEDDHG